MRYRWGFIEDEFVECHPIVEDTTALDFAKQTGEVFYRAKLNGTLSFRFEFDDILAKGYNYEHKIVLQWYDESADEWKDAWMGRFALTDCEINYDTNTINVQPETLDQYTTILDNLDKEFNLVKIKAETDSVVLNIRPCLQIYCGGDSKLTNYVGESFWEANCDINISDNDIQNVFHFAKIGELFAVYFEINVPYQHKVIAFTNNTERDANNLIYLTGSDGITYECFVFQSGNERRYSPYIPNTTTWIFTATYIDYELQGIEDNPLLLLPPNGMVQWSAIYSRVLLQTDLAQITFDDTTCTTYDIPSDDIAGSVNFNYNKIAPIPTACVHFLASTEVDDNPTEWGKSYTEQYFVRPIVTGYHLMPVAPAQWKYASLWFYPYFRYTTNIDNYAAKRQIRDCYDMRNSIKALLTKLDISNSGIISGCLGGSQDYVGNRTDLKITPRSNVISSYYDSPAQNAPITLAKIFNMLKNAYKCYWYVDINGYLHIEHISYYENGNSYHPDEPQILVDLETELHTRTLNNKVYGQNIVKFDKQDMPEHFTFGWGDTQTKPFDGFPINCNDNYVQKGLSDERTIADYDSDVDFVLSSPNDVSKDGFFLFALPAIESGYSKTLKIEKINITDEIGDNYDITIQNADAAFVKIHKSWWRYDLPCENVEINNESSVALTTGNFKLQSVEFSDLAMAEILKDVNNCNKIIRTQQGNGHIKTISINLNSLTAKADLVFNFIGRWYYLKGTALGASFNITINGEQVTINVSNNSFIHRYKEAITALTFDGADVVSVNFADCDNMDNLTSCDNMFKNCAELIAVDFASKKMSAVLSATDMFAGCANLTTLICPDTSTWKADLDFSDCPLLTTDSFYDLIKYLYVYESGTHTITPNSTMWNTLDGAIQDDIIAKAAERGWTIAIPAQYSVTGTSSASTVYATINGNAIEIDVVGGNWSYDYNTPITSISFEGDANVQTIDFSLSDGLAGVTSLDNAFKDCTLLTSVDFTNCDLTNVASANDCFANCGSLFNVTIPSNSWKADVDFSACLLISYAEMQDIIGGLYTYSVGTHTITWNTTYWDTLTQAQQQTISDAADAKGWTTNAVMVVYVIRGTSSNINGTESFRIQFINDGALSPSAAETITCAVDGNGNWEYEYSRKKIYSLDNFCRTDGNLTNNTITSITFSDADDLLQCVSIRCVAARTIADITFTQTLENVTIGGDNDNGGAFMNASGTITMPNATFESLVDGRKMFRTYQGNTINLPSATFNSLSNIYGGLGLGMFSQTLATTITLPSATFASVTDGRRMFYGNTRLTNLQLPSATFELLVNGGGMFEGCTSLPSIDLSHTNLQSLEIVGDRVDNFYMFFNCSSLQSVDFGINTFPNLKQAVAWFSSCPLLTNVIWGDPTFDKLLTFDFAFANCTSLVNAPNFSAATFENVQDLRGAFRATKIVTLNMPMATFAKVTNDLYPYGNTHGTFYDCQQLTTINMPSATFNMLTICQNMFYNNISLATLDVPQNSTAILRTSTAANAPMDLRYSPLSYQSMLKVANWLSDLTGYSAHTCTFKASVWNALSSAEQATIQGVLQSKNYNLATA